MVDIKQLSDNSTDATHVFLEVVIEDVVTRVTKQELLDLFELTIETFPDATRKIIQEKECKTCDEKKACDTCDTAEDYHQAMARREARVDID